MEHPEGFERGEPDHVCLLKTGLYGLKQASRLWYQKLKGVLGWMNFKHIYSDSSIYVFTEDDVMIILPVFDDCTFTSNSAEILDKIVVELASTFRLPDLGPSTSLLGIETVRNRPNRRLSLCQCQYNIDMLQCYDVDNSGPVKMPILPGVQLSSDMSAKSNKVKEYMKKVPYIAHLKNNEDVLCQHASALEVHQQKEQSSLTMNHHLTQQLPHLQKCDNKSKTDELRGYIKGAGLIIWRLFQLQIPLRPLQHHLVLLEQKPKGSRQWFKCDFCGMNGHTEDRCFKRINQQLQDKPSQANTVQEVLKLDSGIVQFTGSASLRSLHPSDLLSPLQVDADVDWDADTGATSHITLDCHWLCNYKPHVVPVHLADSTDVYSAGIGSAVFVPLVGGKEAQAVKFCTVLHVPALRHNLLSVLYLTCRKKFSD
ncbi:hypothetical protein EW146_g444 [Bondarzewia mesenterica]|uniref:Uncharacterized protein n=1 Tax=Bondarzewia mesenterica TaxID=1095465 RepID=A0A4S4M7H3_9AGAM|nr:hypothetical protein EW146_g444 [Bondarzewia mesenterica]